MGVEIGPRFPPELDFHFVPYEDRFFEITRFLLELSGNFKIYDSQWDLAAKLWDHELAAQTMSFTVKPWELGFWTGQHSVKETDL